MGLEDAETGLQAVIALDLFDYGQG